MTNQLEEIQPRDRTDTATAAQNLIKDKVQKRLQRESLEVEAEVRSLLRDAQKALVGETGDRPEQYISQAHWFLWLDPDRRDALYSDELPDWASWAFRKMNRDRARGKRPDPEREWAVLMEVAKTMGYTNAVTDPTSAAPIKLEHLSKKGARSVVDPDEVTPIGRKRISHESSAPAEFWEAEIPHESCDHILTVASPRQGKDSTNARICGNIKDEHGYKWISILDDGRNELPMVAIPNDEGAIRQSLEDLGQTPKAYDTEVFVPAMPGLPDRLPANHVPFTIGVDTLTPQLVLRLGGITSINANTERRIRHALRTTRRGTGGVEQLVDELHDLSGEKEETITITEVADDPDDPEKHIDEISFQLEEDVALQQAANAIAQYAGDGLIEDSGADTNLDMEAIMRRREKVAVLNCNFLREGNDALRYTIMDLWMQLIWQVRDDNSSLPRVCIEVRELKNIAPSQLSGEKYTSEKKATRQTLKEITSQGGSRRVLLVASTQKINDVNRSIRTNMRIKIVLSTGDEGISILQESLDLVGLEDTIKEFDKGQGLVATPSFKRWPVDFAGARCGLGDGDRDWLDRYGVAWGARVRESPHDHWHRQFDDVDWWVEVNDIEVRDGDQKPERDPHYSEWYLIDRDFPGGTSREDVDEDLVESVLEDRREFEIPSDLSLVDISELTVERTTTFKDAEEAEEEHVVEQMEEHDIPSVLEPWAYASASKRENMLHVLRVVKEARVSTYGDIADRCPVGSSAIGNYTSDDNELGACMVKDPETGGYDLTPIGEEALEAPWSDIAP